MTRRDQQWLHEDVTYSLAELCRRCGASAEFIEALVRHGAIEPVGAAPRIELAARWKFRQDALRRSARAVRLQRDLHLNLSGISLVLDLLEELEATRSELEVLRRLHETPWRAES